MRINLKPKRGGVKITGDREELLGLAATLTEAAEEGGSVAHMLTPDGYERVRVVCEDKIA
jgi:hypothetical protein